jgi:hypothetical protein
MALAVLMLAGGARAQTTPPQLVSRPPIVYPPDAHGDATVVLAVIVSRDGEVLRVQVRRGLEPFASAARKAVLAWRFQAAMQDGVAVDGRLLLAVDFREPPRPPQARMSPRASAPAVAPPAAPPTPPLTLDHHDPAQQTVTRADARRVAGSFGDPGRAIEALPGVTPVVSGLGFFLVRGAAPGESAYYVDGVRVPVLEHLGPSSIVSSGLVDRVDMFPGAAPARFGRATGATVALEATPPAPRARIESTATPYDAGALVETPLADGRGSALAAGRFSYASAMLSLAAPGTRLGYWDYQGRATWKVARDDRLEALVFGGLDSASQDSAPQRVLETQFHRVDLRYERALGTSGRARLAATLGADSTAHATSTFADRLAALRFDAEGNLAPELRLRGGADALFDRFDATALSTPSWPSSDGLAPVQGEIATLSPPRDDLTVGAWTDIVWRPWEHVEVTPGVRFDVFSSRFDAGVPPMTAPTASDAAASLDPRIALRVEPGEAWTLTATAGTSHQRPATFLPVPGAEGGRLPEGLQSVLQTSAGAEVALPAEFAASAVAFFDQLSRPDPVATCALLKATGEGDGSCLATSPGGESIGIELMLRRSLTERLTGWLGYTLSSTTRNAHPIPSPGQVSAVPAEFDRTHVIDLVASYDLGRGWMASARGLFYSGRPWSLQSDTIPLLPYDSQRMPWFSRLDVRVEKRWVYAEGRSIAVVLDWLDATLSREPVGVSCARAGDYPAPDSCSVTYFGPVTIPSVGLEAKL